MGWVAKVVPTQKKTSTEKSMWRSYVFISDVINLGMSSQTSRSIWSQVVLACTGAFSPGRLPVVVARHGLWAALSTCACWWDLRVGWVCSMGRKMMQSHGWNCNTREIMIIITERKKDTQTDQWPLTTRYVKRPTQSTGHIQQVLWCGAT